MLKDNCFFEIRGLTVTCQVKKRAHPSQLTASLFHSMCESFSSKDVAEECLRQKDINEDIKINAADIPTSPGNHKFIEQYAPRSLEPWILEVERTDHN